MKGDTLILWVTIIGTPLVIVTSKIVEHLV